MGAEVGILGPVTVVVEGSTVAVAASKERAVLAALALRAGQPVTVSELVDAVWAADAPRSAVRAVQTYVSSLRRRLPAGMIETVPGGYRCRLDRQGVDAFAVEVEIDEACGLLSWSPGRAVELLAGALARWRGEPCADLANGPFRAGELRRLTELRGRAEDALMDGRLALGQHAEMVGPLEAAVAAEPLRERRWAQLILALYRSGRQADAVRAYERLRRLLGDELGMVPSLDLQHLHTMVLTHDPHLTDPPPARLAPADPGRDPSPAHGLPRLFGREDDLEALVRLVLEGGVVTVTGPGGVGKSRLAEALAGRVANQFPDGVAWVELSAASTESEGAWTVANGIGAQPQPGQSPLDAVQSSASSRLVVLDNCEHVRPSAAAAARAAVRSGAVVVATSREPIGAEGERVFPLGPLRTRGPDAPAVAMLRARIAARGGDAPADAVDLAAIADRLDGLPLALELAAAPCRSLGAGEVLTRLEQAVGLLSDPDRLVERHRSLEATMEWSFGLLTLEERAVLCRLSMFAGSFTLDQAERVGGGDALDAVQVDRIIASLVDKSLVARHGRHLRLLETTRQYAAARSRELHHDGRAERAHTDLVAEVVRDSHPGLRGPDEGDWVDRLDGCWPEVRAAIRRGLDRGDADIVIELLAHLGLEILWRRPEGFPWVDEAVDRWAERPHPFRPELLGLGAVSAYTAADIPRAIRLADAAAAANSNPCSTLDCLPEAAQAAYYFAGDYDRLLGQGKAMRAAVAGANPRRRALIYGACSIGLLAAGRAAAAADAASTALTEATRARNPTAIAAAAAYRAASIAATNHAEAVALFRLARHLAASTRNQWVLLLAANLAHMNGILDAADDDPDVAIVQVARDLWQAGWVTHAWSTLWNLPAVLAAEHRIADAALVLGACRASGIAPLAPQAAASGPLAETDTVEIRHNLAVGGTMTLTEIFEHLSAPPPGAVGRTARRPGTPRQTAARSARPRHR